MIGNATSEDVDEVIWRICDLTKSEQQTIIEWHKNLRG
jgi:hypothetical protein